MRPGEKILHVLEASYTLPGAITDYSAADLIKFRTAFAQNSQISQVIKLKLTAGSVIFTVMVEFDTEKEAFEKGTSTTSSAFLTALSQGFGKTVSTGTFTVTAFIASAPPPASPPFPPTQPGGRIEHKVTANFNLPGEVSDYGKKETDAFGDAYAKVLKVDPSAVSVKVTSGSVIFVAETRFDNPEAATAAKTAVSNPQFASSVAKEIGVEVVFAGVTVVAEQLTADEVKEEAEEASGEEASGEEASGEEASGA